MIKNFGFLMPRIEFGVGAFEQTGKICAGFNAHKALILSGPNAMKKSGHLDGLARQLRAQGMESVCFTGIEYEASPESVDAAVACAKDAGCDMVVAIGGGAVLDAGKAVCGIITKGGSIVDYLEGVGTGKQIIHDPVPFIALPTTSGTGSEATKNGVITSQKQHYKKNIRSEKLLPRVAIVDPALTCGCPAQQTAYSGMDALCQLIESYTARKHNPFTDALALEGIRHAALALPAAVQDGMNLEARTAMSLASVLGGICLANSGLSAAHGFASPIGGFFPIRHGLICGILLPHVMRLNAQAEPQRFCDVGEALTGQRFSDAIIGAKAAVAFVEQLNKRVGIPADFKDMNIPKDMIDPICAGALEGSSMKNNPVEMSMDQMRSFIGRLI